MSVRWIGRILGQQHGWHVIGVSCRSNSVARVIISGVEIFNWASSWSGWFFFQDGESYELVVELRYVLTGSLCTAVRFNRPRHSSIFC